MNFRFHLLSKNRVTFKEQTGSNPTPSLLETLCGNDKNLYDALSHFLLVDPQVQLPLLGTAESRYESGLKCKAQGDRIGARAEFEIAARIEISKLNVQKAQEYLLLADTVSDSADQIIRHKTLMLNLDKVKDIAMQYYGTNSHNLAEEKIPLQVMVHRIQT